jgi:hypothetical protein
MVSSSDIVEARRLVALMKENDEANMQAHAAMDEAAIERADIATLEGDRACGCGSPAAQAASAVCNI